MAHRAIPKRPARSSAIAIVIAVAACGGHQRHDDEAGLEPDPQNAPAAIAIQVRDALADMTTAAETHAGDCPAMASALTEVFDRVRPLFDRVNLQRQDANRAREINAALKPYNSEAAALIDRLSTAVNPCHEDPAIVDAMAKMPVIQ
jgi:hypothetical protein